MFRACLSDKGCPILEGGPSRWKRLSRVLVWFNVLLSGAESALIPGCQHPSVARGSRSRGTYGAGAAPRSPERLKPQTLLRSSPVTYFVS